MHCRQELSSGETSSLSQQLCSSQPGAGKRRRQQQPLPNCKLHAAVLFSTYCLCLAGCKLCREDLNEKKTSGKNKYIFSRSLAQNKTQSCSSLEFSVSSHHKAQP